MSFLNDTGYSVFSLECSCIDDKKSFILSVYRGLLISEGNEDNVGSWDVFDDKLWEILMVMESRRIALIMRNFDILATKDFSLLIDCIQVMHCVAIQLHGNVNVKPVRFRVVLLGDLVTA